MKEEIIFSKFCCHRKRKYQILTSIIQGSELKSVKKKAIYTEGYEHINNIFNNYTILNKLYRESNLVEISKCSKYNKSEIIFEFIKGENFDVIMENAFEEGDIEHIIELLNKYYNLLSPMITSNKWVATNEFKNIFGDVKLSNSLKCGDVCNVDMIFSNIIKNDKYYIIDYEWVFKFPIPINYILYRSLILSSGFSKLRENIKKQIWNLYGIDDCHQNIFFEMEKKLQEYIVGQEFSVRNVNKKNMYAVININNISWENMSHLIRAWSVSETGKTELYTIANFNEDVIINLKNINNERKIKIELVPCDSIVTINKIIGIFEDKEITLKYTHNANLQINNDLYFTETTPIINIENNNQFDSIVLDYKIIKRNDGMVKKIVEYIYENKYFREGNQHLQEENQHLQEENQHLQEQNQYYREENKYYQNLKVVKLYTKLRGKK